MTAQVMEKLPRFNPPGRLEDFQGDEQLKEWSKKVSGWFDGEIAGKSQGSQYARTRLPQFFNPTKVAFNTTLPPVPITWTGFPLKIRITQPTDDARWSFAEDPENQIGKDDGSVPKGVPDRFIMDEYLEWSTKKKKNGDVMVASFTCEGPEYWQELAKHNPVATSKFPAKSAFASTEAEGRKDKQPARNDKILNIYKQLNPDFADDIEGDDLVDDEGKYNIYNKWNGTTNSGTIAHLIQRNNTLSAEVDIAAQATIARTDLTYNERITNMITLCGDASAYGSASRNSDPVIGSAVNTVCRLPVQVSIMDPVALYIHDADFSSFRLDPTGQRRGNVEEMVPVPPRVFDWCNRGDITKGMGLHLKVRIPEGMKTPDGSRNLNVSDLYDLNNGGQYVRYGSQFADYMTMSVSGVVGPTLSKQPRSQPALNYTEPFVPKPVLEPILGFGKASCGPIPIEKFVKVAQETQPAVIEMNALEISESVPVDELDYEPLYHKVYDEGL